MPSEITDIIRVGNIDNLNAQIVAINIAMTISG